jgi:O-antigen/teichoic acid export membrane protein
VSTADGAPAASLSVGAIFRRILGNAGKLVGGRAVNAVLSLAYVALAGRALGVSGLGVLVMINAFAQLLGDVVKFQSWQTVLQYGAEPLAQRRLDDLQRVVRFTLLLDLLSGVAGVAAGVIAAFLFGRYLGWTEAQAPLAAGYMLSVLFVSGAAPVGVLRLLDRFDILAAQAAVTSLVRLAGCALGFAMGAGLAFFLAVWAAGTVAGFALLAIAAWRQMRRGGLLEGFRWAGPARIDAPGVWRFAWATNFNSTISAAFTHLVTVMVGVLLGPADAALWRIGRQVADAIAKPVKLLSPALYPELVRLRVEKREKAMWRLTGRITVAATAVGLVLLAISGFAGAPLLTLIMGAGFAAAAGIMTWQVAAAVINLVTLPIEPMAISLGHAGALVRIRVVVAVVFIASLPLLVRGFGLEGVGAGLVAATGAMALGMVLLLLRRRGSSQAQKAA